ncbi:MAG: serine/threonine protein kinase [Defluviitaleaceae bacterium]|nr:serine/threonine protein kinase [Defluviitaleaceae bacterium]
MELAGYTVIEKLAACDDKTLYLIKDERGIPYVLKVFAKAYKFPLYENLAKLAHINMPRILEAVPLEDSFYIIEEYIEGKTLKEILADTGALGKGEALHILYQLCDALAYLHSQPTPIIHRDITPANVIRMRDGRVKLLDFDIAREYKKDEVRDTEVVGTKPYAPPEQYGFAQSDHRADVYALGVLLTVLLTNTYDPRRITDTHLKRVALRCTAIDANKRYRNVKQLKKRLSPSPINRYIGMAAAAVCIGLAVLSIVLYTPSRVAYLSTFHSAATLAPGGKGDMVVYLHDRNGQFLCPTEEPVIWTVEGLAHDDRTHSAVCLEGIMSATLLYVGNDVTERFIRITATSASNPSVSHTFVTHIAVGMPHINVGDPSPPYINAPGRIYFPLHVYGIPDGIHPVRVRLHYERDIWFDKLTPEGMIPAHPSTSVFAGLVSVENGMGEFVFILNDSFERLRDIHFGIDLEIPGVGFILSEGIIRIR